jgi:hypothetical protein
VRHASAACGSVAGTAAKWRRASAVTPPALEDVEQHVRLGLLALDRASTSRVAASSLNAARSGHTATLLPNGEVPAVTGVSGTNTRLATAERYRP